VTQTAALRRDAASDAVEAIGWRYLLERLCCSVAVGSLGDALAVGSLAVAAVAAVAGPVAVAGSGAVTAPDDGVDAHLRMDLRPDRVELSLQTRAIGQVTGRDVELARLISQSLARSGWATSGSITAQAPRPVQSLELAIDAMDIPAIRPFWKAVMAYVDDPAEGASPSGALADSAGQLPTIWFQQMDKPRQQRNRIHFDIAVAHDEADARVQAALAAGGVLVSDSEAKAFWILADVEGNEVCVCTWQDRDPH
jgi:4a-hydroxytetrahydrobiopterin dehydratase